MFVSRTSTPEHKTPEASLGFPRAARITRGAEIQRIAREGKRIRTEHIEVRVVISPLSRSTGVGPQMRVGLIVPRFKRSAVARNRLKRRLRELVRLRMLPTQIAASLVFRVRPVAYDAGFDRLAADIDRAVRELQRWNERPPSATDNKGDTS